MGTKVRILKRSSTERRRGIWGEIYDRHKKRFVASARTSPIERLSHLEYDFKYLKQRPRDAKKLFIEFSTQEVELRKTKKYV